MAPQLAPGATPTASLSIQKAASTTSIIPGQSFLYTIQLQCTAGTVAGCVNAVVTDPLPQYLTIVGQPQITGTANVDTSATTPTSLSVVFTDDLGGGQRGLAPGRVIVIQVPVKADATIPPSADGTILTNTATATADNANDKQSSAVVELSVPATFGAATTKNISPAGGPNNTTATTTATISGTNTSNVGVQQLVITDPVLQSDGTPPTDGNPFEFLRITGVNSITPPQGAETVQLRVYDASVPGWVDGPVLPATQVPTVPSPVDPANVRGMQLIYTAAAGSEIPSGASADVDLELSLRDVVPDSELPLVVNNNADTTVIAADGTTVTSDPASATYRVPPSTLDVSAHKSFSPSTVRAGDSTTATLTGTNSSSDPLDSMTITEPAANTPNYFSDGTWTFDAMGSPAGSGIVWPDGATAATITYQCAGTAGDPLTATAPNTLPAPPAGCDPVTGFTVTFTGSISPGAQATIPFGMTTSPDQALETMLRTNTVGVHGEANGSSGDATWTAGIVTIKDRIAVDVSKRIIPSTVPGFPGQIVTASLSGQVSPFPASTVPATTIVVQDPADFSTDEWYASFNPNAVTATPVPSCSTLTVEYTADSGATWAPIPGMESIVGATIYNGVIPQSVGEAADGIRFVYTAAPANGTCPGGFPPGTSVSPNLSYAYDGPMLTDGSQTITDCAQSSGTAATAPDATSDPACDDVILTPVNPGDINPISKAWDIPSMPERSQQQAGNTISWSTAGFTGIGRVAITDTSTPATTPLAQSVYDAFDLARIDPITPTLDPLLTYDQITKVELYELPPGSADPTAGQWVEPTDDPCPAACDGTFPGYTLSSAQQALTIGYRLTYVESPTRADRLGTPGAPPVGSGVAASTGNNRKIHAVFQLRDARRSDPSVPVLSDQLYNTADAGLVNNTARAEGYVDVDDTTPILTRDAGATILITHVDLTAVGTKTWTGGPLGIPEAGVPQSQYPTSRVTVTASNTSPSKVDTLVISEPDTSDQGPGSCRTSPFDTFNLVGFTAIATPASIGATNVTITLARGAATTDYTRDQAMALTEAQLADVTGMTITYTGRINAGNVTPTTAAVTFDVRLRTADRVTSAAPQPGTVCNQSKAEASDMVNFPDYTRTQDEYSRADITLVAQGIGVAATKTFSPQTITEPSHGPVTVTLSGQPSGPSRTVQMVLEDSSPTFFNQYDFTGFTAMTWVNPVDQLRADVYVGGTWSVVGGVPTITGGQWVQGPTITAPATTPSLPGGVTPAQVQGVRFVLAKSDGSNWENPANPTERVSFTATRRDDLNTGGPVPSDLAGNTPAPGETVAGDATDTTTATVTSSDVDASGNPLTASNSATATVHYAHASNAVQVRKAPDGGTVSPGVPFTYTLTVKNTGNVTVTNPVITDIFPSDPTGPQIQLAPDPAFTFAIAGGTGMPTDSADVTIDESAQGLVFTFPAGSSLPVGATYTITYQAVTRAGLPAGTGFANTVGVTGDRPWDVCDGGTGGGLDPATGQCRAVATDTVISAGAVGVVKMVKAEGSDVLGVDVDPLFLRRVTCSPTGGGFYARPCIPVAQPGGAITWRLDFINVGNLPLDRVLGIDRLPMPGDAVATAPDLARLSEWQPLLSGVRPTLSTGTGTLNVYYTTATSGWCDGPQAADGQLLCPGLGWTAWPVGQPLPVDPATVTGIQTEYLPDTPMAPAAQISVNIPMTAPAYSPADVPNTSGMSANDTYAFNTTGTAARYISGATTRYTLTTEPPRVGVGLAHGGVTIVKKVTGEAAGQYAPSTFQVSLSCVSDGTDVPLPPGIAQQTITADDPVTIYDLPYHATCTLADGANGQTSSTTTSAVVQRDPAGFETAILTNTYDFASLSITKHVTSQAVDQNGDPIPYGPFTVETTCTFLGDTVYASGYDADHPMTADLSDGQTVTYTELPAGASCTIVETDDKGAVTTTVTTTAGDAASVNTDGTTGTIVLTPDSGTSPTNTAVIDNAFAVGRITVTKAITGDAADVYGSGPFTVSLDCALDDASGLRPTWQGSLTLGGGQPLVQTVDDIAAGSECLVRETDDGGASSVTIDPTGLIPVDADATATVTVTNAFDPAVIEILKEVRGDAASFAPKTFPVEVTCTANGAVLPGFPVTVDVIPGTPTRIDTLSGASCTAVETDTGHATDVTYDPAATGGEGSGPVIATDDPASPVTITVTNTYDAGALQIVKEIAGTGAADARGPFVFGVVCAFNGTPDAYTTAVSLRRTGTEAVLTSGLITPLPVGAVCTVSETSSGGADSTPPPVTVTILPMRDGVAQVVTAMFVNTFTAPLPVTGGTGANLWILGFGILVLVAGAVLVAVRVLRRRR